MPYSHDRLRYPFNYRTLLEQNSSRSMSIDNPKTDTDCNFYVLQLTNSERLKLGSALYAGLDLLYPENFIDLMQIWLNAWGNPNTFPPPTGECSVDLCQLIIDCINNTPKLQQTIASYADNSTTSLSSIENQGIADTSLVNAGVGCNKDNLFGAVTGIVDLWDAISKDLLEIIANLANPSARMGDLIEAIPIIGELPADDILQMIESILTDIEQGYDGAWTVQLRNEIRCDLFCLAYDDCEIDFKAIRDYHYNKIGQTLTFTSLEEFLLQFYLLNVTGTATVYALHYFITELFIFSEKVTGLDIAHIQKIVQSLFNDPDSDHLTLCDCNQTWESTLDFTVSDYGVTFLQDDSNNDIGQWVNGTGLKPVNNIRQGTQSRWLYFWLDFDLSDVTEMSWVASFTRAEVGQTSLIAYTIGLRDNTIPNWTSYYRQRLYSEVQLNVPVDISETQTNASGENANQILASLRPEQGAYGGDCVVTSITIKGTGTKPSQLP